MPRCSLFEGQDSLKLARFSSSILHPIGNTQTTSDRISHHSSPTQQSTNNNIRGLTGPVKLKGFTTVNRGEVKVKMVTFHQVEIPTWATKPEYTQIAKASIITSTLKGETLTHSFT